MEEKLIILSNWHRDDPVLYASNLGWQKSDYLDAGTYDDKQVFDYYWKHAFSIVFYYIVDGEFYELFMEDSPFKFWKVRQRPDWDGKWISEKIAWNEHEEGEVLFTFDDSTNLWVELKVKGVSIGDVLAKSLIAEINF